MEKLTMTIAELAATLGVSVGTIYTRKSRDPDSLPKPLEIPGQKVLLWLRKDVEKFLIRFRAEPEKEPVRLGRKPKADTLRKRTP